MGNSKVKNKRKRALRDLSMLGLILFSLIGGIIVIRGFALKRVNTLESGTVKMSDLQSTRNLSSQTFELSVKASLRYCVQITSSVQNTNARIAYSDNSLQEIIVAPNQRQFCFKPKSDDKKIQLSVNKPTTALGMSITNAN